MDYEYFGRAIRRLRLKQHLTQLQLAEMTDISASFLGHIERGLRTPSLETAYRLAHALHTGLDTLQPPACTEQSVFSEDDLRQALSLLSLACDLAARQAGISPLRREIYHRKEGST